MKYKNITYQRRTDCSQTTSEGLDRFSPVVDSLILVGLSSLNEGDAGKLGGGGQTRMVGRSGEGGIRTIKLCGGCG